MAVIDIVIEPEGRTRVWFDCRDERPRPDDEQRIQRAIAHAQVDVSTEDPAQA